MKKIVILLVLLLFAKENKAQTKDFAIKGFHLDLRIQVMKPAELKALALKLSKAGMNTLIMEYEGTFPFEKHPLISNRYAYTKAQIVDFVKYCDSLKIDVIPLQQCFGHVEYILRHERYAKLRESQKDFSQVNPTEEKLAKSLFTDLFQEIAAVHTSKYIHIGCDETHLLGVGPASKAKVAKEGIGKLYGDYVALMANIVLKMGKIPVLWSDIALKHPDALKYLPKGVILVDWNYGWDLSRFGDINNLAKSGFEVWGAPSLRSGPDNYFVTGWQKHFNNIRDFIPQARNMGYKGMILTSWSTSGGYDYLYESGTDIIDLYAMRRVYPLTGFNMLLDAFLTAVNSTEPLNIKVFVAGYCKRTYGFDDRQSDELWRDLTAIPYQVSYGKVKDSKLTIGQVVDSAQLVSNSLKALKPKSNAAEFEHYRLMADTRLLYLRYQSIESRVNEASFTADQRAGVLPELKKIIEQTAQLNKKYIALNKDTYYTSELEQDNQLRIIKMNNLYDRLSGTK